MSQLFIDITELANWQGKLTGVPRVMDELARRFAEGESSTFVIWDGPSMSFRQIDYEPPIGSRPVATAPLEVSPRLARALATGKKIKNSSRVASRALAIPERAARRLLRPTPAAKPRAGVRLQKGDKLLVLADWHASDTNFVSELKKLHQQGILLIVLIYDLLPIVTPQYSGHATDYLTKFTKAIYPISNMLLSISGYTKKDATRWLKQNKLAAPPISVIRLGDDFYIAKASTPTGGDFAKTGLKGNDYLLCVGTVEARKNHMLLYYTYKLARQRGISLPKTLIIGRRGWKTDDLFELITNDPDTKDDLIFLQNTNDEELSWLYEHCLFTVYPSFYEGWGLPIAESLSRGVPCICSDTSSTPEVGGDLVDYFSPASPDECLAAIAKLLEPKALKAARARAARYQPTSWGATFRQVQRLVEEL